MNRRSFSDGYAMLAALLVIALAGAFAMVATGAVAGLQSVERVDARGWRSDALVGEAFAGVADRLRWDPAEVSGAVEGDDDDGPDRVREGCWVADWDASPASGAEECPRIRLSVRASSGCAERSAEATLELRTEAWASGVVCSGDADIDAPLLVTGSGVYVGGALHGRENVVFLQGAGPATPTGAPADYVYGGAYPEAAVHAVDGIYARGVEIHDVPEAGEWPFDTDRHTAGADVAALIGRPPAAVVASARDHALALGGAWQDGHLSLAALPVPPAETEGLESGVCVLTPPAGTTLVDGVAPTGVAGRLLVLVPGDAVVGVAGGQTSLRGALVVCGDLVVRGELCVEGALFAERLSVEAPVRLTVVPEWRRSPLAGACLPVITEAGR